jgi:tetratricopeptide (TPR) repeat protein
MAQTFAPPLAGVALSVLADAFGLRRHDKEKALSSSSARRYFRGERVGATTEDTIIRGFAHAWLRSDLIRVNADNPRESFEVFSSVLQAVVTSSVRHWDTIAGNLPGKTAPITLPRLAGGACLRLLTIDLAVRQMALLWLTGNTHGRPMFDDWCNPDGLGRWLRSGIRRALPTPTRDEIAKELEVHVNRVDDWLDNGGTPEPDNIENLADLLADRGIGPAREVHRRMRLMYGARAVFQVVEKAIGTKQAVATGKRLVHYTNEMLAFPTISRRPQDIEAKMRMTLLMGTLGRRELTLPWVQWMLDELWKREPDPVWRTTLKAARDSSWFEHLQTIMMKLAGAGEDLRHVSSRPLDLTAHEEVTYQVQAAHAEWVRDPTMASTMNTVASMRGSLGATELKIRAGELWDRGNKTEAIELMHDAAAKHPLDAEIHFRLGCLLWQIADMSRALQELEIAIQLKPDWDKPRVEIAIIRLNQDRAQDGLATLEKASREVAETTSWLTLHLAYALERVGRVLDSIEAYEKILSMEPDHAEALDRVAHLYFIEGKNRLGAHRAKRAAQLGIPTVFAAWEANYYDKATPKPRPQHVGLDGIIHFGELRQPLPSEK